MAKNYDVIVAGGGHNGLVVAAYLARAGLSVLVVEAQDQCGGGAMSKRDLAAPGFLTDMASISHGLIQPNPLLRNDELGLISKYGLTYVFPENTTACVFPDDRAVVFYRDVDKTCETIAQFSQHDAEAYRKFYETAIPQLDLLTAGMYIPTPPFGKFYSMLEGSQEGRDLLHMILISTNDIANEWFEDDHMKVAFNRFSAETCMDPRVAGSGLNLFLMIPLLHKYGWPVLVGGSQSLPNALIQSLTDNGGEVRTSARVTRFIVESGECKGVVLESGEEIRATRAVVTNFSIKQLDADMLGAENLSEHYLKRVKNTQFQEFQQFVQSYALHEAPVYKAGKDVTDTWMVQLAPETMDGFNAEFDAYSYGRPWTETPVGLCATKWDTTRAPDGKHVLYLYHYEPYNLKGGAQRWDEIKEEVADGCLNSLRQHTTNMGPENIIGRWVNTPLDLERRDLAWKQGNSNHIGSQLVQQYGNRPFAEVSDYRLPVEKLYLTGPSSHPGASIMGGGRATAYVVMEDLGIDFDDVVG